MKFKSSAFYFFLCFIINTLCANAQNKSSDKIDKQCLKEIGDLSTYHNFVNDNDVVFIFVESLPSSNQSFLDFSSEEKKKFIESINFNQNEFIQSPKNVILYRRSVYLNLGTQKQIDFKNWFSDFDLLIGKQIERNTNHPKIILLPTVDFQNLKSYFSTL